VKVKERAVRVLGGNLPNVHEIFDFQCFGFLSKCVLLNFYSVCSKEWQLILAIPPHYQMSFPSTAMAFCIFLSHHGPRNKKPRHFQKILMLYQNLSATCAVTQRAYIYGLNIST